MYGDLSDRLIMPLLRFSPPIEVYSIDEMFLPARELNPPVRGHPDRGPMGGSGMVRMAFQRVRMDPFRQWKPGPRIIFGRM